MLDGGVVRGGERRYARALIGLILAAGPGRRLGSVTESLPKTLLEVDGERPILDLILANLAAAGIERAVIVTGFASEHIERRVPGLEERHGLRIELCFNPHASERNNAYSLWCARESLAEGVLLVNGDTVHPPSVEQSVLAARGPDVVLALDTEKTLRAEEMKVVLSAEGSLRRISKELDPGDADGEYIGVAWLDPGAAAGVADSLEATWRADPSLYYEDAFQHFAENGGVVGGASIGAVEWVEVDDEADLARAREIACRC